MVRPARLQSPAPSHNGKGGRDVPRALRSKAGPQRASSRSVPINALKTLRPSTSGFAAKIRESGRNWAGLCRLFAQITHHPFRIFPMNQTLETSAVQTAELPSLTRAFFGFVSSTTLACTVMVLLSSI